MNTLIKSKNMLIKSKNTLMKSIGAAHHRALK